MTVGALGIVESSEGQTVEGIKVNVELLPDLGEAGDRGREGTDAVAWDYAVHALLLLLLASAARIQYVGYVDVCCLVSLSD